MALHRKQLQILCRGLHLLKPGGRLVYSTCSLNPLENEARQKAPWPCTLFLGELRAGRHLCCAGPVWRGCGTRSSNRREPLELAEPLSETGRKPLLWRSPMLRRNRWQRGSEWPRRSWPGGCHQAKEELWRAAELLGLADLPLGLGCFLGFLPLLAPGGSFYEGWEEVPLAERKPKGQICQSMFPSELSERAGERCIRLSLGRHLCALSQITTLFQPEPAPYRSYSSSGIHTRSMALASSWPSSRRRSTGPFPWRSRDSPAWVHRSLGEQGLDTQRSLHTLSLRTDRNQNNCYVLVSPESPDVRSIATWILLAGAKLFERRKTKSYLRWISMACRTCRSHC